MLPDSRKGVNIERNNFFEEIKVENIRIFSYVFQY